MALVETRAAASYSHSPLRLSYKPNPTVLVSHSPSQAEYSSSSEESFDNVDLSSCLEGLHVDGISVLNTLNDMSPFGQTPCLPQPVPGQGESLEQPGYFRKWMKAIHRRAQRRPGSLDGSERYHWKPLDPTDTDLPARQSDNDHRRSSFGSSFGFVAAVRSASVSLASTSVVTHRWKNAGRSRTDRSSRGSLAITRRSEDSGYGERSTMADRAAIQRALQRRRILEELISTEEGYIGDVRFLMNVYVTILASLPTSPTGLRPSINRNLTDIVELHEEILGDLHRTVPNSEYTQPIPVLSPPNSSTGIGHRRWRSLDAVPEDKDTHSWLQYAPCITSEAQVAGDVAKIFSRKMSRFFIYEEYGAKYEMMVKDVASAHHKLPQWDAYQRGLEALASSLGAASYHENQSRKSLTIGDLLVKPIQRICRYPLVFAELLRHTPVDDDPNCHMEVENVLLRLREATAEINRATNDSQMRSTLQRTWILQDRLIFANQRIDAASKNRIRSFGHVELCGALYLCWQTKEGVRGQYMVCILYRDVLCLASAGKFEQIYAIEACINLDSIKVEETDNGRGLQCHTAPFSWKLVFECYSQLYEIIMTACTAKEQDEWRSRLNRPIKEGRRVTDPNLYSSLTLGIQSLGTVFSKPGTMARRMAIQRATTVGAKSPLCQVVLKNTSLARDVGSISVNSPLNRSQSLHMNKRIPILAPHRGERTRLETLLSDVWSREVLPFPGITGRLRSEHPVLTTATTMMRKLSVTNIASSLTRRSNSVASTTKSSGNDGIVPGDENHTRLPSIVNENSPNMDEGPFAGAKLEPVSRSTTLLEIPDGSEKRNPTTTSSGLIFQTAEVSGLDRRQCSLYSHGHGDSTLEGMLPAEARALRGSSTDRGFRLRRNKHNSSSSEVLPRTSGKKKKRPTQGAPKKPRLIHRTSSRWGKVGGLNRDTMMRSIRSFFHRGHESHSKDAWKAGVQDGGSPVPYTL